MADAAVCEVEAPGAADLTPALLAAANINPVTRLATDYLNHFNNVVMLLDLVGDMPDFADEVAQWRPMAYPDYFAAAHFRDRDLAIAAYRAADPAVRRAFEAAVGELDRAMAEAQAILARREPGHADMLAALLAGRLRPLIARAGGIINGGGAGPAAAALADTQHSIDEFFP